MTMTFAQANRTAEELSNIDGRVYLVTLRNGQLKVIALDDYEKRIDGIVLARANAQKIRRLLFKV